MGTNDAPTTTSKPFTGPNGQSFESFDACVSAFSGEPAIDDPEAFCAWLQEEGEEALSDPQAQELLAGLEVEFVSAVDTPAQDSEWVIAKDADDPDGETHRWQSEVTLYVRKDSDGGDSDPKQVAFAPVLIPKEADKQGDVIPKPAIEDAAHNYLAEYRKVDSDHDLRDGKGTPVESWTLKQNTTFERPDGTESREYPEGTWVMGIKFDDETWGRVVEGELNGLSIYGGAKPIDVDSLRAGVEADATGKDTGDTVAAKQEEDPCQDGYVMVGTKVDENGNEVPNCVPEDEADEADLQGSIDQDKSDMGTEDDPGDDTGNDGDSIEKQVDAGSVSSMLEALGDKDSLSPSSTIKDFVLRLIEDGDVDEAEVRNMAVLLNGGSDGDTGEDTDDSDDEGDDDGGIDLDADDPDAGKSDDGDKDTDDAGTEDVDKSVDDDGDVFGDAPEWAQALKSEVDDLREQVEDPPRADKMANGDELSDRIAKDLTGKEDADVARKAIQEQVEKGGEGDDPQVDYDGITDGEDADASASTNDEGSLHSAAANSRMVGDN